ncbi:MAG: HutD family protein [Steroidobacteraceae bacterium]
MPEILRAGSRPAVPWKNGGGVTREVAVFPAGSGLADFDWRVSVAEVRAAGAFSRFPGVDRRMAILEGRLALTVEAQAATMRLAPGSAPVFFPGDVPAFGEPLDGAVLDLNVMTRRGRFESTVTCHTLTQVLELDPEQGTLLVLALSDVSLRRAGPEVRLARLDAARIEAAPGRCAIIPIPAPASCYLVRITACAGAGAGR